MPFYLSEYIGTGTKADPFRPVGSEQAGWAAIDLRPDGSRLDGGGLNACLLRVPSAFSDARARFLADDKLEVLSNQTKNFLANRLGLDLSSPSLLRDIIATIMTAPPANGWKAITPGRLKWEIHLGELIWEAPRISGGASDDFNRADATLTTPWAKAAGGDMQVVSNQLTSVTDTDAWWYYSGAAVTADQYSQIKLVSPSPDGGPAVRINADVDCYLTNYLGDEYARFLNSSYTSLVALAAPTTGDTCRLEAEGSTLRHFKNGSPDATNPSTTDSNISAAGFGVGMFIFDNSHQYDDWAGGDLVAPAIAYRLDQSRHPQVVQPPKRSGLIRV